MKKNTFLKLNTLHSSILLILASPSAFAMINTWGATGIYNIPTADVSNIGSLNWSYNNVLAGADVRDANTQGENVNFNFGILSNVEGNFRLLHIYDKNHRKDVYGDFYKRDLSGNLKWQLPFISNDQQRFAIGATDIGGLAVNFRRYYGVYSHKLNQFDLTIGYAQIDNQANNRAASDSLDGLFTGVTYQPTDWLQFLAEKESSALRVGGEFLWKKPLGFNLNASAGGILFSSDEREKNSFRLSVSIPIGGEKPTSDFILRNQPHKPSNKQVEEQLPGDQNVSFTEISSPIKPYVQNNKYKTINSASSEANESKQLKQSIELTKNLEHNGLDFIHLGNQGKTLIVAYQNRQFNRSGLDALASAINTLAKSDLLSDFKNIQLITLENGLAILETSVTILALQNYISNDQQITRHLNYKTIAFLPNIDWWQTPKQKQWADLELNLAYKAHYGTEYANWDYSFALNPILRVPLWRGAHASSSYNTDSVNSFGYDQGRFADQKIKAGMVEMMVHQTLPILNGMQSTLSLGRIELGNNNVHDVWTHQGNYLLLEGDARLYWYHGQARSLNTLDGVHNTLDFNALGAEYTIQPLDLTLGLNSGSFIEGDKSQNYYIRTRLGNASARASFVTSDLGWERVDFAISFPLAPRKNLSVGPINISGNPDWTTGFGTTTDNPLNPSANLVNSNAGYKYVGAIIGHSFKPYKTSFGDGQLTPNYLKNHQNQLIDSLNFTK